MVLCNGCKSRPNLWHREFGNVKFEEKNCFYKNKGCNSESEPKTECSYVYYGEVNQCNNPTDWGNALYCTMCSQASQLCEICGKDLKKEVYFDYRLKE